MSVRVAVNGFGRVGRLVFRVAWARDDIEIVAINGSSNANIYAHLLKYDSTHGTFAPEVLAGEDYISVDGKRIMVYGELDPKNLPWEELGIDVVIESTGKFNDATKAKAHLEAGAKKVLLTAPGKNVDATLVMGVNENEYDPDKHHIISNSSCTTNCLAPVAKIIDEEFGIVSGFMTTVHAYTSDQNLLDKTHRKDLRRARSAANSIIPTTTGAAKAVGLVLPQLKGKLNGFAMRVPVPNVSVVDLTCQLKKPATVESINNVLKEAAEGKLKGILAYNELPLVSIDYNGNNNSSIVDGLSTMTMGENMAKVVMWYDNEWGYSCRVIDLLLYIANHK